MATTQIVSLSPVGQMKQVQFSMQSLERSEDTPIPHFVSPRKIVKVSQGNNHRKRSLSLSLDAKQHHFKRRRKDEFVRPTKFLLGGNSRDPLNLGSLADERINQALNEHTPESSPLPTPKYRKEEIEVLIPTNIKDPLNLSMPDDDLAERALISPNNSVRKKRGRNKKRRRTNSAGEVLDAGRNSPDIETPELDLKIIKLPDVDAEDQTEETKSVLPVANREHKDMKLLKPDAVKHARRPEDKIVSPVVPQPGARKRFGFFARSVSREASSAKCSASRQLSRGLSRECHSSASASLSGSPEKPSHQSGSKDIKRFQYGNYDRYYGYRNPNSEDVRLRSFRREWFEDKDVLDIGCNAGHVTMCVARDFNPRQIVGIDIDPKLIALARKNIKTTSSAALCSRFPGNISFVQGNYVPESDELIQMVEPEYDVILCLSVTKWIHLNWRDAGLKRFFQRIYAHLRPGGKLILEAQGWASYNKRKKLTDTIAQNYASIQLYPERFADYLLAQVGFSTCEEIAAPHHTAKGFRRPIQVFTKSQSSPAAQHAESTA